MRTKKQHVLRVCDYCDFAPVRRWHGDRRQELQQRDVDGCGHGSRWGGVIVGQRGGCGVKDLEQEQVEQERRGNNP